MDDQQFKNYIHNLYTQDKTLAPSKYNYVLDDKLDIVIDQSSSNQNEHMSEIIESLSVNNLIRHAQAQAQQDAKELASLRDREFANQIHKKLNFNCLKPIKKNIEMNRKTKMRVVQHYLCDNCDSPIVDENQGFIVQGNIYVANPSDRGGLVGNNFPEEQVFNIDQVHETVLCKKCFCQILEIPYYEKHKSDKGF